MRINQTLDDSLKDLTSRYLLLATLFYNLIVDRLFIKIVIKQLI